VRIGTWNLEKYPLPTSEKGSEITEFFDEVAVDIWLLTEVNAGWKQATVDSSSLRHGRMGASRTGGQGSRRICPSRNCVTTARDLAPLRRRSASRASNCPAQRASRPSLWLVRYCHGEVLVGIGPDCRRGSSTIKLPSFWTITSAEFGLLGSRTSL